jgi:hypothetical protein
MHARFNRRRRQLGCTTKVRQARPIDNLGDGFAKLTVERSASLRYIRGRLINEHLVIEGSLDDHPAPPKRRPRLCSPTALSRMTFGPIK